MSFGIYALHDQPWVIESKQWLYDFPGNQIPFKLIMYYAVGFASYLFGLIAMTWEPRLKDDVQMAVHHLATLFLIASSYRGG